MRINFFQNLPKDVFNHLTQWLHLDGPRVRLLSKELNDEEKKCSDVVAASASDPKVPDLSLYHLIVCTSPTRTLFKIGFCKRAEDKSLIYQTQVLDTDTPLFDYVSEDLTHLEFSELFKERQDSRDPILLRFMEREIKNAGGLTQPSLRNRLRLANVCRHTRVLFRDKRTFLDKLLLHVAYGETLEAKMLLKLDPSLLSWDHYSAVRGSTPEIHYFAITAFKLALVTHQWPIYEMMLKVIDKYVPEKKRAEYKGDLRMQLEEVEERKVLYSFNKLLNQGVQILDADILNNDERRRKHYEKSLVRNNGFHLIIQTFLENQQRKVRSCVLAYQNAGKYAQHHIPAGTPLFNIAGELYQKLKNASDGYGNHYRHFFTRTPRDLKLVENVLQELGVKTILTIHTSGHRFNAPLRELLKYAEKPAHSCTQAMEIWHGLIGSNARLFSAFVWQFWMSRLLPKTRDEVLMVYFLNNAKRISLFENISKSFFPLPSSMGNSCNLWRPRKHGQLEGINEDITAMACFLKAFSRVAKQKRLQLHESLKDYSIPEPSIEFL